MNHVQKFLVWTVEKIKGFNPKIKTWHVESVFVLLCLSAVAILRLVITGEGWVEWIGVVAVWATFSHASVANRMEEREVKRVAETGRADVDCYDKLQRYFYLKETCWFIYFVLIGAYSALVGVVLFLFYGWWRKTWRKYHRIK